MYNRHNEVPVYEYRQAQLDARRFNRVQRALRRLGGELRLALPGLKTLDLVLQRDAWIVVDRAFNDIPVVAWTDFSSAHREALHVPIATQVRIFHGNAGMVMKQVLESMDRLLDEQLGDGEGDADVLPFRDGDQT